MVESVYDGDTLPEICAGSAVKIRLNWIDASEMAQRSWGQESRDHLRRITPREVGLVERDKDRYGRIVGEISAPAGETSINLAMVEAGWAAMYPRYCKDPAFYAVERRAREAGRGIWEREGAQQRPWEVRR